MAEENQDKLLMFGEVGKTGLNHMAGEIFEEKLRALERTRRHEIYQEMSENDATIGAVLFVIEMLIRKVDWKVQEASQSPEDIEAAEFLRQCMGDMNHSWREMVAEIVSSMMISGFAPMEVTFKKRLGTENFIESLRPGERPTSKFNDGLIGWHKIALRSPETITRWNLTDSGDILGMIQQAPPKLEEVYIPIEKVLLFRTSVKKNNPEGKSILRNAYRSWFFKKRIENIEAIGVERDLAGIPMAEVPAQIMTAGASAEEKAVFEQVKKIVQNIRRDEQEGLVFPSSRDQAGNKLYDFKLLTTGGSRQFKTGEIIQRYRQDIALTVVADFILIGHEKVGSFSLASSKTSIFTTAIGAWLDMITDIFNSKAVPMLFFVNGRRLEALPRLTTGDIESIDLAELGQYVTALTGAGISLTDEKASSYLKAQANIPIDSPEE